MCSSVNLFRVEIQDSKFICNFVHNNYMEQLMEKKLKSQLLSTTLKNMLKEHHTSKNRQGSSRQRNGIVNEKNTNEI